MKILPCASLIGLRILHTQWISLGARSSSSSEKTTKIRVRRSRLKNWILLVKLSWNRPGQYGRLKFIFKKTQFCCHKDSLTHQKKKPKNPKTTVLPPKTNLLRKTKQPVVHSSTLWASSPANSILLIGSRTKKWGLCSYCWWTKSCTTNHDDYPIIYRVLTIPGGAGFCPSTVSFEDPKNDL